MILFGYRVETLAKCVGKEVLEDDVLGLSAEMAYYFFFSLFPILLFLTPMLSLFGDSREVLDFLFAQLAQVVPPEAQALVADVVRSVVFTDGAPGLISIGAVLALWAGSNLFNNLITALNRAYDVEEARPWWKRRLVAMTMVLVSGITLSLATITLLAGAQIVDWVGGVVGLDRGVKTAVIVVQYVLALLFLVGTAFLIYWVLPNTRQHKGHVLVGAVFACVLWVLATLAFKLYVVNFGNYNKTYGTIGAIIVLLTWMYLSMLVLLTGAELASELYKGTGSVTRRTGHLFGGRVASGGAVNAASTSRIERVQPSS